MLIFKKYMCEILITWQENLYNYVVVKNISILWKWKFPILWSECIEWGGKTELGVQCDPVYLSSLC